MVDIFALAVSHALLALAVWRLLSRDDLYDDAVPGKPGRKSGQKGHPKAERQATARTGAGPDA